MRVPYVVIDVRIVGILSNLEETCSLCVRLFPDNLGINNYRHVPHYAEKVWLPESLGGREVRFLCHCKSHSTEISGDEVHHMIVPFDSGVMSPAAHL